MRHGGPDAVMVRRGSAEASPSREMEVLLEAARGYAGSRGAVRLRRLLMGELDWRRLYELAVRHKMVPLLHWSLRAHPDLVPADVQQSLEQRFRNNAARTLGLAVDLVGLVRDLGAEGLLCVPYKGPALAAEAYGNLSLRQPVDLDVVVRRRDLPAVRQFLRARGYTTPHDLGAEAERLMERSLYHEEFRKPGSTPLEVHWAFTDKHLGFSIDLEALEPRLRTISLGGARVPSLGVEDLLLALCVHGAKHRWSRLEWLASLAAFIRAQPPAWEVAFDRAGELGSRRVLLLGLRLSAEMLELGLPEHVRRFAFDDPAVAELAAHCRALLLTDIEDWAGLELASADSFYVQLADRPRDRLRFLLYRLTTPSQARTWKGVRVGKFYLPLHVLSRPLRAWRALFPARRPGENGPGKR